MNSTEVTQGKQQSQLLWIVLGVRISLFLVELGVGLWNQSLSLLAGSAHIFSDLVTLGLALLAAYLVERKSRVQEAFSYQRLKIWVALLNGFSLMAIAFLLTWETVSHLQVPESKLGLSVLLVAGLGLAINILIVYLLHKESDVLGLLLAWGASILARRQPTLRRTYGLRRSSILAALLNACFLLVVSGGIGWEAI